MVETNERYRVSQQVLLATLWWILLVLAVKVWVGWGTGALSILAEALHTAIDSVSTLLSLIAISSPNRSANGREIWGHSRLETSLALLLVALLGFGCFSLAGIALQQLVMTPTLTALPKVRLTVPLIQIITLVCVVSFGLAWIERRFGRRYSSPTLTINANHLLKDAWLTIVLLLGTVGIYNGYRWLDPLLTLVFVFTAGLSCWRLLNWQMPFLVRQVAIAPEAIAQIVRQVDGVTHCFEIQSRGVVGRQVFVEMRLVLHPEFLNAQDWISQQIEGAIRERYGPVQVMVQVDNDANDFSGAERAGGRSASPDLN
jgi:cation diffusion facilitator family transporter